MMLIPMIRERPTLLRNSIRIAAITMRKHITVRKKSAILKLMYIPNIDSCGTSPDAFISPFSNPLYKTN